MSHSFLSMSYAHWPTFSLFVALSPEMEAPYASEEEKMRLLDLYRDMHGRIHNPSRPLKLIYHVAARETLLAWVCHWLLTISFYAVSCSPVDLPFHPSRDVYWSMSMSLENSLNKNWINFL